MPKPTIFAPVAPPDLPQVKLPEHGTEVIFATLGNFVYAGTFFDGAFHTLVRPNEPYATSTTRIFSPKQVARWIDARDAFDYINRPEN